MNPWVIAFPCLVYLTSFGMCLCLRKSTEMLSANVTDVAMGIAFSCQVSRWSGFMESLAANVGIPYFSISISLNVLLTLMISGRLILHSRNIRNALGAPAGVTGLCKAIVTTLIESCALYAVCSLLFIASWAAKNWVAYFFLPILAQIQVRGVLFFTKVVSLRRQIGHRSVPRHFTSRQTEHIEEQHCCSYVRRVDSF